MQEKVEEFIATRLGYLKKSAYKIAEKLDIKDTEENINTIKKIVKAFKIKHKTISEPKKIKRLFYDIETSYNIVKAWRIGYNLNLNPNDIIHERAIICVSYKWEGEDKVKTIQWDKGCDKNLVTEFVKIMLEADELVGHNIDRFDTKWFMTRAIKHGILALPKYQSYDTLKKARRHFNFNSNKLDYIAKFLGLGGKYKHPGLEMWDDIILRNDTKAMAEMIFYCEKDVLLTEEVFNKLKTYTEPNVHHGMIITGNKISCPQDGSLNIELIKTEINKSGTIKRLMRCSDCQTIFYLSNTDYLKFINQ